MATRILFVDDEVGIRLTLAPILERHGFFVVTAASVSQALEKINREKFDVLLSDLNVGQPGDGFTVVSAMRRVQPRACTFILTGYPDFESAISAIRNQVDDYFAKSLNVDQLLDAITQAQSGGNARPQHSVAQTVSALVGSHVPDICDRWLKSVLTNPEIAALPLTREE